MKYRVLEVQNYFQKKSFFLILPLTFSIWFLSSLNFKNSFDIVDDQEKGLSFILGHKIQRKKVRKKNYPVLEGPTIFQQKSFFF